MEQTSAVPENYESYENYGSDNDSFPAQPPVQTFQAYWLTSKENELVETLRTYAPPIIITVGLTGNILAFLLLQPRHKLLQSAPSVRYYLSVLLLTDAVNLCFGCGLEWLSHMIGSSPVAALNDWACKLYQFTFNVLTYSSFWLLLLLLTDRIVCVRYRQLAPDLCSTFAAKVLTAFVYVGLVSVSVHTMWTFEVGSHGCNIDPRQKDMYTIVWPWIAAVLYSYLPLTIIIVLVIILLIHLCKEKKNCSKQYLPFVVILAIVFLSLTLPFIILNFIDYSKPAWLRTYRGYARFLAVAEAFQKLGSINHAVTHVVCFACSPEMRGKFGQWCRRDQQTTSSTTSPSPTAATTEEATRMITHPDADNKDNRDNHKTEV